MNKVDNKTKRYFTQIPNDLIRNSSISDRARFLYCYMSSMSEKWDFYQGKMAKDLGYSKDTLRKYLDELISTGYLKRTQRRGEKGRFDSYDYVIDFIPDGEFTVSEKTRHGEIPTREKSALKNKNFKEEQINKNKNFKEGCDFEKSPPFEAEVNNPFERQKIHDNISYEQKLKERKIVAEQKERKSLDREPSETYAAFSAFAATYERLAGVTYPSDKNNYIMTAKDGANCKKLVTWLKKVSASEQAADEMVTMFTTAAWQISDKWLKANFTISNIYSQANNIYTKFMYQNPAAQEKRRQEEIDRLVNEFEG
jgi:predicted transcriptional regulator